MIRRIQPADLPEILALNQANLPALGPLSAPELETLLAQCAHPLAAELDGRLAGFALVLDSQSSYASPNYRWFVDQIGERWGEILYLDRIAIHPWARKRGVGRALYAALSKQGLPVACEVNTVPLNQESLDFHAKLGFEPVGEGHAKGKQVRYLMRR